MPILNFMLKYDMLLVVFVLLPDQKCEITLV